MAKFGNRGRSKNDISPLAYGYYIANALLQEGAHIDMILDLPLTVTIRFTMKANVFKQKVQNLIAWNLTNEPERTMGQVIKSEQLTNDVWSYEVQWIKAFFTDEVKELAS